MSAWPLRSITPPSHALLLLCCETNLSNDDDDGGDYDYDIEDLDYDDHRYDF